MPRNLAILFVLCAVFASHAGELIPTFSLIDSNRLSLRHSQPVNPRDYRMQVFAIYFANSTCSTCRGQFERLSELQRQLRLTNGNFNIEIFAINEVGQEDGTFTGGTIPWIQDRADVKAWDLCQSATGQTLVYRDVWIANPAGQLVDKENLTSHPLTVPQNFETLRTKLLNAARMIDSDGDKIPDYYEMMQAGGLSAAANSDTDADGFSLFQEFAFGSVPISGRSRPFFSVTRDDLQRLVLKYKVWGGNLVEYTLESSVDLVNWSRSSFNDTFFKEKRMLYGSTGHAEMTLLVPQYQHTAPVEFLRVTPHFNPAP